jgi:hypothetical protein
LENSSNNECEGKIIKFKGKITTFEVKMNEYEVEIKNNNIQASILQSLNSTTWKSCEYIS